MSYPECDLLGRHLSLEHVVEYPRTCQMRVEELVVIGELVIVTCQACQEANKNKVHIFDLMTNLWRDDISLDRGGREILSVFPYTLRHNRFHVLSSSLLGFLLTREEISIQQLGEDRRFTLLYIINFRTIWLQTDFIVDSFFIRPDTFFFFGNNLRRHSCILEATVGDVAPNDPQVRILGNIHRIHVWALPATEFHTRFRYETNVYMVRKNETVIFDCSTRELSGVRGLGAQLFAGGDLEGSPWNVSSIEMMLYELPSLCPINRTNLIPSAKVHREFEEESVIEWWTIDMGKPRWHFCLSPFARSSWKRTDPGIRLPSGDILFVGNSNSIYRIPARCFGKVKNLTELAKDALLAVIPAAIRVRMKGSVVNIESLGAQVYTNLYS